MTDSENRRGEPGSSSGPDTGSSDADSRKIGPMPVRMVNSPHPAVLDPEVLSAQCGMRAQRRSGPGGQHRNKTSSGVFLCHQPTSVTSEATERRSQADNRQVALSRLRYRLAVEVRSPSSIEFDEQLWRSEPAERPDPDAIAAEASLRRRYQGSALRIADSNRDKPAVLAMLLNDLHAAGGRPNVVAVAWGCSASSIVRLLKSCPNAFTLLNTIREHHRRRPLK